MHLALRLMPLHLENRMRINRFIVLIMIGLAAKSAISNPAPNLKEKNMNLTKIQKHVTQENGTEPAFNNDYWNNHAEGIYVDIQSGEVLFSSLDKFDSGTGWPSFTKPLDPKNVEEKTDSSFGMTRTEVRSMKGNAHLGHLFTDGPKDKGGLRYCINSASLRFIPKDKMVDEGYGEYFKLFEKKI